MGLYGKSLLVPDVVIIYGTCWTQQHKADFMIAWSKPTLPCVLEIPILGYRKKGRPYAAWKYVMHLAVNAGSQDPGDREAGMRGGLNEMERCDPPGVFLYHP